VHHQQGKSLSTCRGKKGVIFVNLFFTIILKGCRVWMIGSTESVPQEEYIRCVALPWQCQATQVWKPLKPTQNLNTQCCYTHSIGPHCTFRISVVWCLGRQHERTRRNRWGTAECPKPMAAQEWDCHQAGMHAVDQRWKATVNRYSD